MSLTDFQPSYFSLTQHGDVVVAAFQQPQLTEEENLGLLGQELFALVEQYSCRRLIVCFDRVEHVTSIVVGKLITLHRKLHRNDGVLVLCGLRDSVSEILTTSRLISYFNVADNVNAALAMLGE